MYVYFIMFSASWDVGAEWMFYSCGEPPFFIINPAPLCSVAYFLDLKLSSFEMLLYIPNE